MSVYAKLNEAREKFHASQIKKTGRNNFAGYDYFELGDFIVPALRIFKEVGLLGVVSFGREMATLTIIDAAKPDDKIVIESPMSEANLKGCHPVQNLGAVQTYIRRYLWVAALEIVEHDALDSTTGKDEKKAPVIPARPAIQLDPETEAFLQDLAMECMGLVKEGKAKEADQKIRANNLDGDQEIALANIMDSASRSAITKARREWVKAKQQEQS